jgi:hypothetical protein
MHVIEIVSNQATASEIVETDDVVHALETRGYWFSGAVAPRYLRPELQGHPRFTNCAGPMWGGTDPQGRPIIRYEDLESYEILSR